jgi:hypothetical protein
LAQETDFEESSELESADEAAASEQKPLIDEVELLYAAMKRTTITAIAASIRPSLSFILFRQMKKDA